MHGRDRLVQIGPERLRGAVDAWAACLLQDARFDPVARLKVIAEEDVTVLCQAPTEYRMIAKRAPRLSEVRLPSVRRLVSAGEPLNPDVIATFHNAVGLEIQDGYGQTETGQLTGMPATHGAPGFDGKAAARIPDGGARRARSIRRRR